MRRGSYRTRREVLAAGLLAFGLGSGVPWSARSARADQMLLEDGRQYTAYVAAAAKSGQFDQYTCEFDAAWSICKTFGLEVSLAEQVAIVGIDQRIDPYVEPAGEGYVIYGGAIDTMFSGDYTSSYLARARSRAMRKVFDAYGLPVEPVDDRPGVEAALRRGGLIWVKSTVDYLPYEPATWITPEGEEYPGALGNEHAAVVIGYNADVVVIRDMLGPTASNWQRPLEYEVPWDTFLYVWDGHGRDGIAVFPSGEGRSALTPGVDISGGIGQPGVEVSGGVGQPIVPVQSPDPAPVPAIAPAPEIAPAPAIVPGEAPSSSPIMPVEITGSL